MADPENDLDPAAPAGRTPVADVLQEALRKLVVDGRERLLRVADDGRVKLRIRALQRDRDALWVRLGKIAYRLHESGEIEHPAIAKAMARVDEIDAEIERLREETAATRDRGTP